MKPKITLICIALASVCACNEYDVQGLFVASGEDVNTRFAKSMEYVQQHPLADLTVNSDEYKMYVVTDIHSKGDCPKLVKVVSTCLEDASVEKSLLCLGDLVTGKDSYESVARDLSPLDDAGWNFFTTPGNHDLYYGLWRQYGEYWPLSTYSFKVVTPSSGQDFFIFLDSAEGKLGTEQRKWLETTLSSAQGEDVRNIYVLTHTHFFKRDSSQGHTSNYSLDETMDLLALFAKYGVDYVLTGHDHSYEHTVFRGVEYYTLNALVNEPGSFYLATFSEKLSLDECTVN